MKFLALAAIFALNLSATPPVPPLGLGGLAPAAVDPNKLDIEVYGAAVAVSDRKYFAPDGTPYDAVEIKIVSDHRDAEGNRLHPIYRYGDYDLPQFFNGEVPKELYIRIHFVQKNTLIYRCTKQTGGAGAPAVP